MRALDAEEKRVLRLVASSPEHLSFELADLPAIYRLQHYGFLKVWREERATMFDITEEGHRALRIS